MSNTPVPPDAEKIAQQFKEFAYIVSHDLSSPLRAIVEFSKLLKAEHQDRLTSEGFEYLSLIIESGHKMQAMMEGLLDFSRLDTMSKTIGKVSCQSVINDCKIVLRDKITATCAVLDIGELPTVKADAEQLMQLFLVLLDNALTYHSPAARPHIGLTAQQKNGEWEFCLRDNGIGIEPPFHERIFQPFQKLHSDLDYPGTGMGLTLAKKIVERHHGRIWVVSNAQEGAAFYFTLPINDAPRQA